MKKIFKYALAILVVLSMMLAITGCGNKDKDKFPLGAHGITLMPHVGE